jgi:hypothetical protein
LNLVLNLIMLIGAVLAAWMRLKYPHIAVGALSSSAPILQFEDIVPSTIFYDLVSDDFRVCIFPHPHASFYFVNDTENMTPRSSFSAYLCSER